jgi:biofilm PGA synthesis lipoprotein PgaB
VKDVLLVLALGALVGGVLASVLPLRRTARKVRRRSRSLGVRALRAVVGGVLSTALVVVPSAVFVRVSLGKDHHQSAVPEVHLSAASVARFGLLPPFKDAVPVVTYHDLADSGGRYSVSPEEFARQLAMLRAAGFTSITARQFESFLDGTGNLPEKPILITFDDGASSAWRVADPILARYGMNAVLFVITAQIGRHAPYYLSSRELRTLRDSGRWELEAHTDDGHHAIVASPSGKQGPFLTNRAWLTSEDRYETLGEFETRVGNDLDRSIRKLRAMGVDPHLFAFPFSAATTPSNDKRVIPILHRLVAARFEASLVDSAQHRYVSRVILARYALPRFLVTSNMSAQTLFDDLAASEPLPLPGNLARPLTNWVVEQDDLRSELRDRGGLRFAPPVRTWISVRWTPKNALPMRDATLHVVAAHLGTPVAGSAVTLVIRPDDNTAPATVTVGPSMLRIRAAKNLRCALVPSPSHRLAVAYRGDTLRVTVDNHRAATLRFATSGGSGIGLGAWRDSSASPQPIVRELVRDGKAAALRVAGHPLVCTSDTPQIADAHPARGGRALPQNRSTYRGQASSGTTSPSTRRST